MSSSNDYYNIDELTKHRDHLNYEQLGQLVSLVFKPGGYFSHHFPTYNYREDQERMAQIIAKGISNHKAAIIEAGTGTGKSHGCLIPSALYASICNKRVLVVTHNIALQTQLYAKDLPVVKNVLGSMGLEVNGSLLKGKGNYICTKKLKEMVEKTPPHFQEETNKLLEHALKDGELIVGDKEALPYAPDERYWSQISPSADQICDGCPFKDGGCFYKHNKKNSESANIIISNQFLLIADLIARKKANFAPNSGLVPDYDVVVIDEAHHIEEVASEFLSVKINKNSINQIFRRIDNLLRDLKGYHQERKNKIVELCKKVRVENEKIFADALEFLDKKKKYTAFWDQKLSNNFDVYAELYETLVFNAIRLKEYDKDCARRMDGISSSLKEFIENLKKINSLADELEVCYWITREKDKKNNTDYATIVATPVEVNQYLKEALFDRMPVIMTSATIKFDKDLSFFAKKVGNLEEHEYESGFMDSPFDYQNQVCFYIPSHALDAPKSGDVEGAKLYDEYCMNEMLDLVKMSKGRAFLLFTNNAAVNQYYQKLAPIFEEMGYLCLKQGGEYDRNQMISMFKEHGNAVLFGAATFWEGISVDGRELSLVVIHKLPFDVPTPVSEARRSAIEKNGGDPFLVGNVFSAVTKYKQGFGRLIRHESDKGVFCVLDGRILSHKDRYGKYFIKGTPITARSVVRDELVPFFE